MISCRNRSLKLHLTDSSTAASFPKIRILCNPEPRLIILGRMSLINEASYFHKNTHPGLSQCKARVICLLSFCNSLVF
jgi:hypothetical protein